MRIGIIRLGSLGDIIHTLPALAALRKKFPMEGGDVSPDSGASRHQIEWMVESAHAAFLIGHPLLDAVHILDTKRWRRLRRGVVGPVRALRHIRQRDFDVVLDFQGLLKSALLAKWTGAAERIGYHSSRCRESAAAMFYTQRISPPEQAKHVIEMNLSLLQSLGIEKYRPVQFPLGIEEKDRRKASDFFGALGWGPEVPIAALYPGAGWETKRWGVGKFAALGDRLSKETGAKILVVWGPGEKDLVEALERNLCEPAHRIPATSVREMAAFLERCQLLVGGDTGPLHLAAALGVPTVAIVGPTTPARNGPFGPSGLHGSIVHREIPCSHCYQRTCPGFGTRCLTEITVDEVAEAALATWNHGSPRAGVGAETQEELYH